MHLSHSVGSTLNEVVTRKRLSVSIPELSGPHPMPVGIDPFGRSLRS